MNMIKKTIFGFSILFFILLSEISVAQKSYWLEISDQQNKLKGNTADSSFIKSLNAHDIKVKYYSSFLQAYSVLIKEEKVNLLHDFDQIKNIRPVKTLNILSNSYSSKEYTYALEQINANYLIDSMKLSGKGVKIGVIDGGFMNADKQRELDGLIQNERIIFFKDYLKTENTDPFYGFRLTHDHHGTEVLKFIGGYDQKNNFQQGMATQADYYLFRTDHGIRENKMEEDYWVMALELLYDKGVRLVNSSVGYTNTFDDKKDNHRHDEVDGHSSMISRAAEAAAEKGMLVVIAAGNDGNSKWQTLSLPADAEHTLAVGATDYEFWSKQNYSSIGPETISYIKPDIACYAANGTSYSAPVITGLAACIWEYDSTLSNYEVMTIIKNSGHLSNTPNNYLGNGVPNGKLIAQQLKLGSQPIQKKAIIHQTAKNSINLADFTDELNLIAIHKKNKTIANFTEKLSRDTLQKEWILRRPDNINYSTVFYKDIFLMEIEWLSIQDYNKD